MIYTEYDKLTTLKLNHEVDRVSFQSLAEIILARPSNVIYCELNGKLYGIISMGDVERTKKTTPDARSMAINRGFTFVLKGEYIKAKNIFSESKRINAIPILDENGMLLGNYSRWNHLHWIECIFRGGILETYFPPNELFILVYPDNIFEKRWKIFNLFKAQVQSHGKAVKCVKYMEIPEYLEYADWILFTDQDELRAVDTLLANIFDINFDREKLITYEYLVKEIDYKIAGKYMRKLKENGVGVFNLVFSHNEYFQRMEKKIEEKFELLGESVSGELTSSRYEEFYDDLYTESYAEQIKSFPFNVENKRGIVKLKDYKSLLYNVTNGIRQTVGQPKTFKKSIYFYGPCFIYGHYTEDCHTIESFLQKELNEGGYFVKVVNCGSPSYSGQPGQELARIMNTPLKKGDIVVLYLDNRIIEGIPNLNLMDILEKSHAKETWMVDFPAHCNWKINSLYAKDIFQRLKASFTENDGEKNNLIEGDCDYIKLLYLDKYFTGFNSLKYEKVGSIVMNCNPFTLGHRYLIEQARRKVDFLIIFVVEENKSFFSFEERFAMVCEGIEGVENAIAVPSGPFILSQTTFPEYFIKEVDEDIVQNAENDIMFFAEQIAPRLNITYRFVGEEPEDVVTNEYNIAMKKILPKYDIELVEIPRAEAAGTYISASLVRKYLMDMDIEKVKELIPESTRQILGL